MGLDLSLNGTAWCTLRRGLVNSGRINAEGTQGPQRLATLAKAFRKLLFSNTPDLIVLEGYSYGSPFNREAVAEWGGVVRFMLWEQQIATLTVAPMTLKKYVLPAGVPNEKQQVMLASFKRWGVDFLTNDECDAHALAQLGRSRLMLETGAEVSGQRQAEAARTAEVLIPVFPWNRPTHSGPVRRRTPVS